MAYFAGLDISMDEMHVCVVDRDGRCRLRGQVGVDSGGDRDELAKAASRRRIAFETGRTRRPDSTD